MVDGMTRIDATLEAVFPSSRESTTGNGGTPGIAENSENTENAESAKPAAAASYTVYPEELLHVTPSANKYFLAFQSLTCSFIDGNDAKVKGKGKGKGNGEQDSASGSIVQFHNTNLDALSRRKVDFWHDKEQSMAHADSATENGLSRSGPSHNSAASSLFAWSSSDKYIEARKREFQRKMQAKNEEKQLVSAASADSAAHKPVSHAKNPPKPARSTFGRRLNMVVENESNRFIQDRIEVIKAHHSQQAARKIDERRRHDHEMHLRRVQLKEEKYENALKAAIALQNTKRSSGFFGALFGPKPVSQSFTLDITDGNVPLFSSSPRASTPKSQQLFARKSRSATPEVVSRPLSVNVNNVEENVSHSQESAVAGGKQFSEPHSPQVSARSSSLEFEEYQSSTDKTAFSNGDGLDAGKSILHSAPVIDAVVQPSGIDDCEKRTGEKENGLGREQTDISGADDSQLADRNRSSSDLLSL